MRPQRVEPGPGQESVWDHPRPPALDPSGEHVVVRFGGEVVEAGEGSSHGGWITSRVVAPFEGAPGTMGW